MTSLLTTWDKDPTSVPFGPLGIIAMPGCEKMGEKVNQWLLKWHSLQELQDEEYYTSPGADRDSFLLRASCPRFGTGEGKAVLRESVRGLDLYIITDVYAHNITYKMYGQDVPMSPLRKLPAHSRYLVMRGLLKPSSSLKRCRECSNATITG